MEFGLIPSEPMPGQLGQAALRSDFQPGAPGRLAPPNFTARAAWIDRKRGRRRPAGRGRLWISPDKVCFVPDAPRGRQQSPEFVHAGESVEIRRLRLRLPWAATCLLLQNGSRCLSVTPSGLGGRKLRHALQAAGLNVRERAAGRRHR